MYINKKLEFAIIDDIMSVSKNEFTYLESGEWRT